MMEIIELLIHFFTFVGTMVFICLWPIMVVITALGVSEHDARRDLKWGTNPRLNKAGIFCVAPFKFYINSAIEVGIFIKINRLLKFLFYH